MYRRTRSAAEKRGLPILATVVGHATHSQEPAWFTTAPVGAIRKLYERTGWNARGVDLYEINEAFAVVTLAAMKVPIFTASKNPTDGSLAASATEPKAR